MAFDLTFNLATLVTVGLAVLTGSLWVGGLNIRLKQLEAELARKDANAAHEAKDNRISHDALNAQCNLLREQLNEYKLRVADTMVSSEQLREVRAEFRQSLGEVRSEVNRLPDAIMDRMTQVLALQEPGRRRDDLRA